jgi:hypothetical protein
MRSIEPPGVSRQSQSRPAPVQIAPFSEWQRSANAVKSRQTGGIGRACFPAVCGRYRSWEVGSGRATRQPGQVRKEAALTSAVRVARQPPTHCFAAPRLRRHFGANAAELARCSLRAKPGGGREARAPLLFRAADVRCALRRLPTVQSSGVKSEGHAEAQARLDQSVPSRLAK